MSEMSLLHTRDHCDIQTGMLEILCQNFVVTSKLVCGHLAPSIWQASPGQPGLASLQIDAKRRSLSFLSFSLASFY